VSNGRAPQERIDFVLANLIEHQRVHGAITNYTVAQAAERLGVSSATIRRWVASGGAATLEREGWQPTQEDKLLFFECRGNVAEVFRRRIANGLAAPSRRQLERAFHKAFTPAERAFAKDGEEGYRRHSVYLRVEQAHRNELWQADHVQLPIWVTVPRRTDWFKPWGTFFIETTSRAIPGYAISLQPTAAEVLAGLRSAMLVDLERGPFGGVPDMVLWDNGAEFLSDDVTQAMADLGCYCAPTKAYSPHQKGKIERFFNTLNNEFLRSLTFYAKGPRSANGKLYGPSSGPMGLDEFVARLDDFIQRYNNDRVHSAHGMTPLEAWEANPHPLQLLDEEDLRWMLLGSKMRKIRKDGVLWGTKLFFATELHGLVGEEVEVRYMPHDLRRIWLYRDGEFLCEAVPQEDVPDEVRAAHIGNRIAHKKQVQGLRRETSRKERVRRYERRGRIEPMTGPGEIIDTVAPVIQKPKQPRSKPVTTETLDILGITGLNAPVEEDS
jgi:putative transposase